MAGLARQGAYFSLPRPLCPWRGAVSRALRSSLPPSPDIRFNLVLEYFLGRPVGVAHFVAWLPGEESRNEQEIAETEPH